MESELFLGTMGCGMWIGALLGFILALLHFMRGQDGWVPNALFKALVFALFSALLLWVGGWL
jgi:hypothetical protein